MSFRSSLSRLRTYPPYIAVGGVTPRFQDFLAIGKMNQSDTRSAKRKLDTCTNEGDISHYRRRGNGPVQLAGDDHVLAEANGSFNRLLSAVLFQTPESLWYLDGLSLLNLIAVAGPVLSKQIRYCYLFANYAYVAKQLRILRSSMADAAENRSQTNRHSVPEALRDTQITHQNCGRNVKVWMSINPDWRGQVKDELIAAHQTIDIGYLSEVEMTADFAFNNISIAVELGLEEVVGHVLQLGCMDMSNENNKFGALCLAKGSLATIHLIFIAAILEYRTILHLLLDSVPKQGEIVQMSTKLLCRSQYVSVEARACFLSHPNV